MKYIFITVVTETGGRCLIYFERKMDSYFFISHLWNVSVKNIFVKSYIIILYAWDIYKYHES